MFCSNCGNRLPDNAAFCPMCGAKVIVTAAQQQPSENMESGIGPNISAPPAETSGRGKNGKKPWKWLLLLIPILVIIILIAIITLGGGSDDDANLFSMAEKVAPYKSSGFDGTYGELINWMIAQQGVSYDQDGDTVYLRYSGRINGGEAPVEFVLKMSGLSNEYVEVVPYSMTLNEKEVPDIDDPEGILLDLIWALKNKADYPTFNDYINWCTENGDTTFDRYFGFNSVANIFESGVKTPEDAMKLAEEWLEAHPIAGTMSLDVLEYDEAPENVRDSNYVIRLTDGTGVYLGDIYILKMDGTIINFNPYGTDLLYAIDDWYNEYCAENGDGTSTASPIDGDYVSAALRQYRQIVSQAADQFGLDYASPTGNYFYALVQMQPEDIVPTLLLEQETETGIYYVRLFQYDPDSGSMIAPEETMMEGVAMVGGYRGGISMEGDGNGIRETEISSGTGHMDIWRVTLEGGELKREEQWSGIMDDELPEELTFDAIEWYDIHDTSALDG